MSGIKFPGGSRAAKPLEQSTHKLKLNLALSLSLSALPCTPEVGWAMASRAGQHNIVTISTSATSNTRKS